MPDVRSALSRPLSAVLATACVALAVLHAADVSQLPPAAPAYDFDKDIKPLLESTCVRCHGEQRQKSSFRLDTRDWLLKGGEEHDKVILPGHSEKSPLIQLVSGLVEDIPMPPKKEGVKLTAKQIGLLRAWIDAGAKYPPGVTLVNTNASAETAETAEAEKIAQSVLERGRNHWAYKAPVRPALPQVKTAAWVRTPIDAFVLARLEKEGLTPSPEADKATLLRRLSPRPDRPAADARGGRRLPRRPRARRLREAGRAAAGVTALRRALGPALARRRALRRHRRLREGQAARRLVLPRLGHQRLQPRPALRPVRHRADSPATSCPSADAGPDRRHRLPAQLDDQRGRGHRSRAVPHGGDVRPHGRHRQGHPRPDDPVRPVPQPQVRSDHAGGVLPALRLPEQRRRGAARRLHARRADEARRACAGRSARSKTALRHATPDWPARMARWEDERRRPPKPKWTVVQPLVEDISTGGAAVPAAAGRLASSRRATPRPSTT